MGCELFRWLRIPVAALAFRMQASTYVAETPPVPARLHQSVHILAQAFVPDFKISPEVGRLYALIQVGKWYYPLLFRNPDLASADDFCLNTAPVVFLERRLFSDPLPGGQTDTQGFLVFEDPTQALAWFIDQFTHQAPGELVPVAQAPQGNHSAPEQHTRPTLPDLEKMRRYQAELEADEQSHTLSEQERACAPGLPDPKCEAIPAGVSDGNSPGSR